jgi:integrase
LKFDLGTDPGTGKRLTKYHSFKGTKREAEAELIRLKASAGSGNYIDASKICVAEFLGRWQADWVKLNLTPKTAERYEQLIRTHIVPRIGKILLQKLKAAELAAVYSSMMTSGRLTARKGRAAGDGLSPQTAAYVHRVLHRALGHAVQWGILSVNPAESVDTPRGQRGELAILTKDQIRASLQAMRGSSLYPIAALGLSTGMRRGELLALRWKDVDLDKARLRVERSLEQTKATEQNKTGLRFKEPKTTHGRRSISLPASIVTELRSHRRAQLEQRVALSLGKEAEDALVFAHFDGSPLLPHSISTQWRRVAVRLKLKDVTLHAWRHTHASQLIAAGMDVLSICRRLGHGSPSITLDVYGHLFHSRDDQAAAVFENAFGGVLTE